MAQKTQFIADYVCDRLSITELCALYRISRKTAYQWIDRDLTYGPHGLEERSRRPRTSPRHTPDHVGAAILDARRRHPSWGAKKPVSILSTRDPHWPRPARSTICDILSRHNLVPKQRKRRAIGHSGKPTSSIDAPRSCLRQAKTPLVTVTHGSGQLCYLYFLPVRSYTALFLYRHWMNLIVKGL
jgi:putative transposase